MIDTGLSYCLDNVRVIGWAAEWDYNVSRTRLKCAHAFEIVWPLCYVLLVL
jgi:hypothetical protein